MKKGDLCYLYNPDADSKKLIKHGHGYIWVYAIAGNTSEDLAYFTSLATGEENLFYLIEMQQLNKEQDQ